MRLRPSFWGPFVVGIALLRVAPAGAQSPQNSAAAQALFDEAKMLMSAGKAREACPKFEESQRLDPGSGTLLNLALCYEQTGRLASAWTTYRDAASAAKDSGNAERERGARERAAALAPRISKLVVEVPPESRLPELVVLRDGTLVGEAQWGVPIPTDEGSYTVSAKAPGHREWHVKIDLVGSGKTQTVSVPALADAGPANAALAAAPPSHASPTAQGQDESAQPNQQQSSSALGGQRIAALAVGGVGAAGLVVGGVFGVMTISKHRKAAETCTGNECTTDAGVTAGNDAHAAGTISTIAMIAGAAALAGGAVLWFTAPTAGAATQVGVTPGGLVVRRSF